MMHQITRSVILKKCTSKMDTICCKILLNWFLCKYISKHITIFFRQLLHCKLIGCNCVFRCENSLCSLMSEKFPYMKNAVKMLLCYVKNLLQLTSYLQARRFNVLECIIEKLIHIDVSIT